jgi:MFS family permease
MDSPLGPRFRRFVAASGATNLADGIATLAWAWVASLLTRDALLVALVPVALRLPWFLFAVPAGIVTDRVDRRHLILAMDSARALAFAAAALAVALAAPFPPPAAQGVSVPWLFWAILAAALAVGAAEVFRDNAAQTMLPALVPHARLEAANGRLWSVEMVANALIGPPLAALLIAVSVALPFAVNAAMMAAAVLLVLGLPGRFRPGTNGPRDWRSELGEGARFLLDAPLLRLLAVVTGVWNLFFQMAMIALILYAQEVLGLGATGYGLILAAGAVGGMAGGFAAERIVRRFGPARTAQWALFTSAPSFLAIAALPLPLAVAATLAVFEFAGVAWNAVSVSYRQRAIPDALLGRVNSLYRLLAWGMMPVGLLASGLIVRAAEPLAGREAALAMPFWLAALGAAVLTLGAWKALGDGLSQTARRADPEEQS